MRVRNFILGTTLISLGLVNANARALLDDEIKNQMKANRSKASTPSTSVPVPLPAAAPSTLVQNDKVLTQAYYDTFKILREANSCSEFFGGSTKATVVFNTLMGAVQREYLDGSIGMRMSGETMTVTDAPTNTRFRMFKKAAINARGPFYRNRMSPAEAALPRLGNYEPNTKAMRSFILLHELGHLMKGDDGNWLLPDDGKSQDISRENSAKIENVCGEQIKQLTRTN
jgi:hypothetical protein